MQMQLLFSRILVGESLLIIEGFVQGAIIGLAHAHSLRYLSHETSSGTPRISWRIHRTSAQRSVAVLLLDTLQLLRGIRR